MSDEPPSPPPADTGTPLGERLATLEGIVQAEDKLLERGLQSTNNAQVIIIGIVGLIVAGSLAMLVYVLQRMDSIATMAAAAAAAAAHK